MSLQFSVTPTTNIHLANVVGRIDSANAASFEKDLLSLFDTPQARILVDLTGLDYISSAGLRVVLMAAKRAKQSQGRLVLCGMQPHVREVFEISGFIKILEIVADRAAGEAALSA